MVGFVEYIGNGARVPPTHPTLPMVLLTVAPNRRGLSLGESYQPLQVKLGIPAPMFDKWQPAVVRQARQVAT